jgi:hypothetical protein
MQWRSTVKEAIHNGAVWGWIYCDLCFDYSSFNFCEVCCQVSRRYPSYLIGKLQNAALSLYSVWQHARCVYSWCSAGSPYEIAAYCLAVDGISYSQPAEHRKLMSLQQVVRAAGADAPSSQGFCFLYVFFVWFFVFVFCYFLFSFGAGPTASRGPHKAG